MVKVLLYISFIIITLVLCSMMAISCQKDISRYTADQVIEVAQKHSPEECNTDKLDKIAAKLFGKPYNTTPIWNAQYLGDGKWLVTKTCKETSQSWYFNEDSGSLSIAK